MRIGDRHHVHISLYPGVDDDLIALLAPYRNRIGGEAGRALKLLRRGAHLPEPGPTIAVNEETLRQIVREEIQSVTRGDVTCSRS